MEIISLTKKNAHPFSPYLFSTYKPYIGTDRFIFKGIRDSQSQQPLGVFIGELKPVALRIHFIFIDPSFRRQKIASKCLNYLETIARTNGCTTLTTHYVLPADEIVSVDSFLKNYGFDSPRLEGEVFCFNPHRIVSTKFIKKTFARGKAFLPESWQLLRYDQLDNTMINRLIQSKEFFPDSIDWNMHWDTLDLHSSILIFNDTNIIGYITQRRLTSHSVVVPCFAIHPSYRGAGLCLLKNYMYIIHFETPEIFEVRCHFTPMTSTAKKLFMHYTENRYNRHSIEKTCTYTILSNQER